ncbi:uncharacterized protein LOC143195807 isoform X2 [Rhynchophorus ferrugineus]|uniref:uncharacterized protein LOC143195807 isoform X2 n=1 Tax=Rhynchophorus ferrugineus TaxID=354439 RepID=UPI003FCE7D60
MNNCQELVIWLRKMNFTEEIPDSFVEICNNSTLFIWEQLMQNVVHKREAENIKKNIILHRLQQKDLNRQDEFIYKMKDVELFRKKKTLQNKLHLLNDTVQDKQIRLQQLSHNTKVKELTVDFLKKKLSQNKQRKYLLDLKKQQLENQNHEAVEMLTKLRNVTPVEVELSNNTKEITKTLEKCSEKLTEIIKQNLISKQNITQSNTLNTMSKKKKPADMSSIASYMAIREKKDFNNVSTSLIQKFQSKENISPNISPGHVKRNMLRTPEVLVEVPKIQPDKRESLGILNESFLNNDSFFDVSKTFLSCNKLDNNSRNNEYFNTLDSNDSVIFNYNKKSNKDKLNNLTNKNYNDDIINMDLHEILKLNNRHLVYNVLQKIIEDIKLKFTMMVSMPSQSKQNKQRENEDDVAKLQAVHIQTELNIIRQKRILVNLLSNIAKKKAQILEIIGQDNGEYLDFAIKEVRTDTSLAAMKKEINSSKLQANNEQELQIIQSKIFKIKNEIGSKMSLMQLAIEELNKVHMELLTNHEKSSSPLWRLRLLKAETNWMQPMLDNLWETEIKIFESFPLEYQRQCTFTDKSIFYRDLCINNYSELEKINQEDLQILCSMLDNPLSPPETVLSNLIRAKEKLKLLNRFKERANAIYTKKYSFDELQKQESYLSYAIDSLKTIMRSFKASKTLAVGDFVEQSMKIWLEMPVKDLISHKRIVEGQTYQFYEEKLKCLI